MKRIFITGTAGFIGFHLAGLLLREGLEVHGYDAFTDYYDVTLKERRNAQLLQHGNFSLTRGLLEESVLLNASIAAFRPDAIVHLAAQVGVRHSIDNPRAYIDANIIGTFNVLECARQVGVRHLLLASTSSVYGASQDMPFRESGKADTPLSFYAATKKATEAMGHAHAHIWNLPITMFRFFTVYGPWGRPDMALFKFTDAILDRRPIDIYNHGDLYRDFTYVGDLVNAIRLLLDVVPEPEVAPLEAGFTDSLSPVAPFRIVNIGNSEKVRLLDFVEAIEAALGTTAIKNFMDMQPGDMAATWADATLLKQLTGYRPQTGYREGVQNFVSWFRDYYNR